MFFLLSLMGNLTYGAGVCPLTNIFCFAVTDPPRSYSIPLRSSTSSRICLGSLGRLEPSSKTPSSSCNSTCTARKHRLSSSRVESWLNLFVHYSLLDGNLSIALLSHSSSNIDSCLSTASTACLLSTSRQRNCRYRKHIQTDETPLDRVHQNCCMHVTCHELARSVRLG